MRDFAVSGSAFGTWGALQPAARNSARSAAQSHRGNIRATVMTPFYGDN
jgi:hypothetical protein